MEATGRRPAGYRRHPHSHRRHSRCPTATLLSHRLAELVAPPAMLMAASFCFRWSKVAPDQTAIEIPDTANGREAAFVTAAAVMRKLRKLPRSDRGSVLSRCFWPAAGKTNSCSCEQVAGFGELNKLCVHQNPPFFYQLLRRRPKSWPSGFRLGKENFVPLKAFVIGAQWRRTPRPTASVHSSSSHG